MCIESYLKYNLGNEMKQSENCFIAPEFSYLYENFMFRSCAQVTSKLHESGFGVLISMN